MKLRPTMGGELRDTVARLIAFCCHRPSFHLGEEAWRLSSMEPTAEALQALLPTVPVQVGSEVLAPARDDLRFRDCGPRAVAGPLGAGSEVRR